MMMQGDIDLNPVQLYTDSFKEVLKHTMLNQDVVFRNQVHELHRLYSVQESLMNDFGWRNCNTCNSWNPKAQSSFLLTNPTRYEPPAKDIRFSSTAKVDSIHFVSQELSEDCQVTNHKLQHKPLDLQLSADEFIDQVEKDFLKRGNFQNCLDDLRDTKLPLSSNFSDAGELKLSLSIGGNARIKGDTTRTCFTRKSYSYSQNVIDLEESVGRIPDGDAKCPPTLGHFFVETHSKSKHEPQGYTFSNPVISTSVNKDLSNETAESSSMHSECCQVQTFSSEGIRDFHDDVPPDDHSTPMEQFTSELGGQLDLNKVHLDDSICCSDDDMPACPPIANSEDGPDGCTGSMQDGTCPSTFRIKEPTEQSNECSEELDCCSGDEKSGNVEPKPKFAGEESYEKSEVENALVSCSRQNQNTLLEEHGNVSPASWKSCISYNDSSPAKRKYSGITSCLGSQLVDALTSEHDERISDSSDLKNGNYEKKEVSAQVDVFIQQAAELLIHISSDHSACDQVSFTKVGLKDMEDGKRERPQCSLDSFELITLNLAESNMDDNSVSSKPFEVNDMESKDFGLKLKRGRRMKDFQREILPSLASLSRREILEDINIMEGVLRSREYRKFRAKTAVHGENRSSPVRIRRSRLGYAGRKNISSSIRI